MSDIDSFINAWKKLDQDDERQLILMESMLKDFEKNVKIETKTTKDNITSKVISDDYKVNIQNY